MWILIGLWMAVAATVVVALTRAGRQDPWELGLHERTAAPLGPGAGGEQHDAGGAPTTRQ